MSLLFVILILVLIVSLVSVEMLINYLRTGRAITSRRWYFYLGAFLIVVGSFGPISIYQHLVVGTSFAPATYAVSGLAVFLLGAYSLFRFFTCRDRSTKPAIQ